MFKIQSVCLVILATIAVGFSLYYLQSVLLPFVIALFIVIGCRPIMEFFQRRLRLPQFVAFGVTFMIGLLALTATGFVIWASINDVSRNAGAYEKRLGTIATWVTDRMDRARERQERQSGTGNVTGDRQPQVTPPPSTADADRNTSSETSPVTSPETVPDDSAPADAETASPPSSDSSVMNASQAIEELLDAFASQLQTVLLGLAASLSTLLSYGVLIMIFVFFLLVGNDPTGQQRPTIVNEVEEQVRKYLTMKTVISFFTGFTFGGVLWLFGVPLAVVFGFLAFLLNFIPNIGPLIANVLPVPFLILNSEMGMVSAILCLVLISAIQFISGNVIETRIMGKSFDVSPVVLLMSLMFFGLVWGIVGMFLATPIVSIIKIVLQQYPEGKPMAELMAGRWSPAANADS